MVWYKRDKFWSSDKKRKRRKWQRKVRIYSKDLLQLRLKPTVNNLFFSGSKNGRLLFWKSVGCYGFRGPRRTIPFSTEQAGRWMADYLVRKGLRRVELIIFGLVSSRVKAAIKGLIRRGAVRIYSVALFAPISHNGLRSPKSRRV